MSTRARAFGHRPRPAWMLDLHRWLGGLATIFVGVHVLAILADSYVHFTLAVGARALRQPLAPVGGRLGRRRHLPAAGGRADLAGPAPPPRSGLWRLVHFASFPLFLMATVHAFTAGTDAGSLAFVAVAIPVIWPWPP